MVHPQRVWWAAAVGALPCRVVPLARCPSTAAARDRTVVDRGRSRWPSLPSKQLGKIPTISFISTPSPRPPTRCGCHGWETATCLPLASCASPRSSSACPPKRPRRRVRSVATRHTHPTRQGGRSARRRASWLIRRLLRGSPPENTVPRLLLLLHAPSGSGI